MKIAIIGSRDFDEELCFVELNKLGTEELQIISGGARGVDSYAREWCEINKVEIEIIKPINPANKLDYLFRNVEIITKADKIIIFWDGISKGSAFTIKYALSRNKDVIVISPKGEVIKNEELRNMLWK